MTYPQEGTSQKKRTKRSVQLPMLVAAAFLAAKHRGKVIERRDTSVLEAQLGTLQISITPWDGFTWVDVWDETRGGAKVMNVWVFPDRSIEMVSFRRGDWEDVLLSSAKQLLH